MFEYCVYYEKKSEKIIDFFPANVDTDLKSRINEAWTQPIMRKILLFLSEQGDATAPRIKEKIGHSMSTLHENIKRLQEMNLISATMIYESKKQKILKPIILFVTKNPRYKTKLKKFFQGIWVNSKNSQKIIAFLEKNPKKYYTIEEISLKTKIPADDVHLTLNNWDSFMTRGLTDLRKEIPFEKKTLYKFKS